MARKFKSDAQRKAVMMALDKNKSSKINIVDRVDLKKHTQKYFNISTIAGLNNAERYKGLMENKYNKVETKSYSPNMVLIKCSD